MNLISILITLSEKTGQLASDLKELPYDGKASLESVENFNRYLVTFSKHQRGVSLPSRVADFDPEGNPFITNFDLMRRANDLKIEIDTAVQVLPSPYQNND
jgi:hypothetical protein